MPATNSSVGVRGATHVVGASESVRSGLDNALRSTFPVGVSGKASNVITADGTIPTLDDDTDYANNVSRRLRGYIVPPKTGNYYFWIAASNSAGQ